ncbi:hypothetical protein LTR48_006985 [Friedmanniomyces endolithicus]|uniref:Uncharacterized protein n=1 Tax=Rachicladosporium monterosium TaxID=1507873 RepID=A0ABR0KXB8_9PEZI|nr:hypothetical protein LTR48_006985 [Friedmanniomyces endolithicus]KAK5140060.1 hypothetical protein LTR32_007028 [Rachicladosporium monterosium]
MAALIPQPADSFEPNHATHIQYPSEIVFEQYLEQGGTEAWDITHGSVLNIGDRHDPLRSLVADKAVAAHQCREGDEASFYSLTKADAGYHQSIEATGFVRAIPNPAVPHNISELFVHMRFIQHTEGVTILSLVTAGDKNDDQKAILFCERSTHLWSRDDGWVEYKATYAGIPDDFYNVVAEMNPRLKAQYMQDMVDLVWRVSDRAVRHVYDQNDEPNCQSCRELVFADEVSTALKYGTNGPAYTFDPRYSVWENIMRSLADLDKYEAAHNHQEIFVDTEILMGIFNHIRRMDDSEPLSSTPQHLQYSKMAGECRVLASAVRKGLSLRDGQLLVISALFTELMARVNDAMCLGRFHNTRLMLYNPDNYTNAEMEAFRQQTRDPPLGFPEYSHRLVNRFLQFYHLRQCTCAQRGSDHYHGLKRYWR